MTETLVVNLAGDAAHGQLADSQLVAKDFTYGGEAIAIGLAFAAAALGRDVELRGWVDRALFELYEETAGAAPRVGLEARPPADSDLVVVPEGWRDPLEYLQLSLSPARLMLFVLAAPGLFGWDFETSHWSPPDPLTVALDAVAQPAQFLGMRALGFELLTHSHGLERAAHEAGVGCAYVGVGRPAPYPEGPDEKEVDVLALGENRWAPLADQVLAGLDRSVSTERLPRLPHAEVLDRMGRARVLAWPSRIEGHATIPIEARAMACVPVALDTNRFGADLDDEHGVVTVHTVEEMPAAIEALLGDAERLAVLSARGREVARRHDDWDAFVGRVRDLLDAPRPARAGHSAAAAGGASVRVALEALRDENRGSLDELAVAKRDLTAATKSQEELLAELEWTTSRKLVAGALWLDRFVRRR